MDDVDKNRRSFVEKLGRENRNFYGTLDGRGLLNVIELTFDHRWVYLYELVQNALDASASSIALRLAEGGDALIFQHNGDRSLDEKDVEGLSKVFRSTKGARSVGFMGVGFKSIFMRFREARVSGWGWKFRYETTQVVGEEYGDVQRDLLGAVVPVWDETIVAPEHGFSTRFDMRGRTNEELDIESDLARFLPDDDRAPLAILAMSGLARLEIDGQVWELGVSEEPDGSVEATALSKTEDRIWRVFSAQFQPSKEAIACFLEHRRIQPSEEDREQVYADAARARRVLGVLPLDNDGMPAPPDRGHVYATLPTEVTLPFGLHINADWLLNISRSGLRGIEDNPWQRDIVDNIAEILARFIEWTADRYAQPDVTKAAFKALAEPSSEAGGVEALLAEECWLSRLRNRIEDAAVFPVWTEKTGTLAYAKASDTLVPPPPLAKAFRNQPELRPTVLLKGSVLMDEALGRSAVGLLRRIGLLSEMSPQELERAWDGGLEDWWKSLPDKKGNRRRLLFRIWVAAAEFASDEVWRNVRLPCVRSITGEWFPVGEVVFLNEALPAEDEPGGSEARQFMQSFIPDQNRLQSEWVATLRQRRQQEPEQATLSSAWDWLESHARSIGLRKVVEDASNALTSSTTPDWAVLAPMGYWTKHRNRPDLLTHVLVQSNGDQRGVPVEKALLADPYVENGQDRRRFFGEMPVIAGVYLEGDPKKAGAHEWRTFLERAGASGELKVRQLEERVGRWERQRVTEFLGIDAVGESNNSGYRLLDFDIQRVLPDPDAPEELRTALAGLLEDGFRVLKGTGRRKTSYTYYSPDERTGNKSSAWAIKLSDLAWVPCNDGVPRCPRDVLNHPDPAREDAPVAKLSSEFLSVLEQEGVIFGTEIPEATSLRRLLAVASQLDAEELAELLSECREQATTDIDRRLFDQALENVTLPSSEIGRVPLDRIVQRTGGRLRGALGGWIVPLDRIEETLRVELEHAEFPRKFPETATGDQALDYLRGVWRRARSSPEGLANEVRDVLPTAYAYCLEDCAKDASLLERWGAAAPKAMVFAEREWIPVTCADDIYFDDIEDRRFLPGQGQFRTVTGGHLGRFRPDQLRTVEAIGLPLLSSIVSLEWFVGDETLPTSDDWVYRFKLICDLLRRVRGSELAEGGGTDVRTGTQLRLTHVGELGLEVRVGSSIAEHVPVNARLHEGVLTVAGRPPQFGADAAKEFVRHFSFGQRAGLAADLTGMLMAIENTDFNLAADKFRRSHLPSFELPALFRSDLDSGESVGFGDRSGETGETAETSAGAEIGRNMPEGQTPASGTSEQGRSKPSDTATTDDIDPGASRRSEDADSNLMGGSYTKDRALAKQNALARQLRTSLKGEIVPSPEEEDAGEAKITNGYTDRNLGDEEYREIVAQYEREAGREPELGDPHQPGWDIRSTDPKTNEVRLIEVKGKGRPWNDDEVVELSGAQIRKAFDTKNSWYLYVVEKTGRDCYQVLPIANPVYVATKWILFGESWRMVAEEAKAVAGRAS